MQEGLRSRGAHDQADFDMNELPVPANDLGAVQVQLIDSSSGRPIRVWNFCDQAAISIGRSNDQLVDIGDPYVSRNHARLDYRNGEWSLVSLGRHGVVVANQLVTDYKIENGQIFRLGMEGPTLRFQLKPEPSAAESTIHFEPMPEILFQLNKEKLRSEVGQIAEGTYFLKLQARAKQMRSDRPSE